MLINALSLYSQYDCGMALGSLSDGKVGLHYPDYPSRRRKISVNPVHTRSVEVTSVCLQINKLINSKKLHNYWDALQTKTREKNFQYSKLYFSLRFGLKFQAHGNCFGKAP